MRWRTQDPQSGRTQSPTRLYAPGRALFFRMQTEKVTDKRVHSSGQRMQLASTGLLLGPLLGVPHAMCPLGFRLARAARVLLWIVATHAGLVPAAPAALPVSFRFRGE